MKHHSRATHTDETITCHSCLAQISRSESFCPECGAPVSTASTLEPLQTIQTEGFVLRRALEGRPKLIVLLGIWVLHLPVLAGGVTMAVYSILYMNGFTGFIFFWAMTALACFAFVVLYRITKNFVKMPKKRSHNHL